MTPLVPTRIETDRLVLRTWTEDDRVPFGVINADPEVTRYVGGRPLSQAESDALIDRTLRAWDEHGYGWYAVADHDSGQLLGFCGLSHHRALPDDVEVGWRLARHAWGRGLATEAAVVCRDLGFGMLGRDRLISITVKENVRSWRVMQKLGMAPWRTVRFEQWDLWVWAMTRDDRSRARSS